MKGIILARVLTEEKRGGRRLGRKTQASLILKKTAELI
jgi:hypothetical protein